MNFLFVAQQFKQLDSNSQTASDSDLEPIQRESVNFSNQLKKKVPANVAN